MARVLNSDAQRFSSECEQQWSDSSNGRRGYPAEAPASALGMDNLLQLQIDKLDAGGLAVIDRDTFTQRWLEYISIFQISISDVQFLISNYQ